MSMDSHRNPDGTYDGIGVMSQVSGLSRADVLSIAEQVKANHAKLNSCAYHEFAPILPLVPVRQRYRCINCGGEIDAIAHMWHERGRDRRPDQKVDR